MTWTYKKVEGHGLCIDALRAAVVRERVAHAYLFAGPEGIGKELVARAFMATQLCEAPVDGAACGVCKACEKVGRGAHPDVMVLEADGKFIKIEAVRNVTKVVAYPPIEGKRRVVLIREADQLHEAAANALLKTLEEPSGHTMFVLTSSHPTRLLDTIISRCQVLRFNRLTSDEVETVLKRTEDVQENMIPSAVGMANGSVGEALQYAHEDVVERRRHLYEILSHLTDREEVDMLSIGEEFAKDKKEVRLQLGMIRSWYRDLMVVQSGADLGLVTNRDWVDALADLGKAMSAKDVLNGLALVDEVEASLRFNVNARLAAERLFLGLYAGAMGGRGASMDR